MVKRSRVYNSNSSGGGGGVSTVGAAVSAVALYLIIVLSCGGGGGGGGCGGAAVAATVSLGDRSANEATFALAAALGRYPEDGTAALAASPAGSAPRNGRSAANLSHITGTARKIKMFIKHRYLQVFPDGTVNSTAEDTSDYVILQRTSVNMGQLKIQGVATCMYLCMDACGLLYGSKDFEEECVFNEMMERHNYNTYTSAKYSNDRRALYLALNKHGTPRKVQVKANAPLGKLSTCTRVLTQPVPQDRIEQLMASRHGHRHHHGCPPHTGPPLPSKHRKSAGGGGGRKCQGGKSTGDGRKKSRDDASSGGRDSGSREETGGGGGGGGEISHRKSDAAGRKKKSKKPSGTVGGKGADKSQRPSKARKPEPDVPPEPVVVVQTTVTAAAAHPSHHAAAAAMDADDDDDDGDNDEEAAAAGTSAATVPTDEFLEVNNNN